MPALSIPSCVGGLGAQGSAEVAKKGVFHFFSGPLTYVDAELVLYGYWTRGLKMGFRGMDVYLGPSANI